MCSFGFTFGHGFQAFYHKLLFSSIFLIHAIIGMIYVDPSKDYEKNYRDMVNYNIFCLSVTLVIGSFVILNEVVFGNSLPDEEFIIDYGLACVKIASFVSFVWGCVVIGKMDHTDKIYNVGGELGILYRYFWCNVMVNGVVISLYVLSNGCHMYDLENKRRD
ncbi:MAG: hypothetical protein Hyperionvirus2_51 [Hyperionvirus sp.]|uniref:Uncharacterized protein n=1 Tax=Hyperionvirus sp. TaxID=2487770 RepID=A0A3G5AA06_9VIRU|nr:MAG: hypothetical protein Hyperionvirus2_51 [Hyperionvirus sp.]